MKSLDARKAIVVDPEAAKLWVNVADAALQQLGIPQWHAVAINERPV